MSECEGKFFFYICIGMLLISLSCWCKGKYSGKYSLGFSEESYQGEYNFLSIVLHETKWSSLLAGTGALILYILI